MWCPLLESYVVGAATFGAVEGSAGIPSATSSRIPQPGVVCVASDAYNRGPPAGRLLGVARWHWTSWSGGCLVREGSGLSGHWDYQLWVGDCLWALRPHTWVCVMIRHPVACLLVVISPWVCCECSESFFPILLPYGLQLGHSVCSRIAGWGENGGRHHGSFPPGLVSTHFELLWSLIPDQISSYGCCRAGW